MCIFGDWTVCVRWLMTRNQGVWLIHFIGNPSSFLGLGSVSPSNHVLSCSMSSVDWSEDHSAVLQWQARGGFRVCIMCNVTLIVSGPSPDVHIKFSSVVVLVSCESQTRNHFFSVKCIYLKNKWKSHSLSLFSVFSRAPASQYMLGKPYRTFTQYAFNKICTFL